MAQYATGSLGALDLAVTNTIDQERALGITIEVAKRVLLLHWAFEAARADTRWRRWLWVPVLWCLERMLPRVP